MRVYTGALESVFFYSASFDFLLVLCWLRAGLLVLFFVGWLPRLRQRSCDEGVRLTFCSFVGIVFMNVKINQQAKLPFTVQRIVNHPNLTIRRHEVLQITQLQAE